MSNIISISRRSTRTETMLSTAVDPTTFSMPDASADAITEAITILEKGQGGPARLSELVIVIKQLVSQLKRAGVSHGFTKKDLVIWLILEVLATNVGVEDMLEFANHRSTLDELALVDDGESMICLLRGPDAVPARQRYQSLLKSVLG